MPLTRRRALLAGAGSLLGAALPARGVAARGPRSLGLTVTPADFDGGRVSRVLRPAARFDLVGVRAGGAALEVRTRRPGRAWSRWAPLVVRPGHAPDGAGRERASEPVWAGGAAELQLRAPRAPRGPLRVHLVVAGRVPRRRRLHARFVRARGAQPAIQPRAAWGGDTMTPRKPPELGQVQVGFVHHTAGSNDYRPEDTPSIILAIAKYHRDVNGWNDIGYNFVVDRYGQLFEGRAGGIDQPVVGAQTAGHNKVSTGVAVLGSFERMPADAAALEAVAQLLAWKLPLHGAPVTGQVVIGSRTFERIAGHRDGFSTSCPGSALYAQLPALRERAEALAGTVVARAQASLEPAADVVPYGHDAVFRGAVRRADGTPAAGEPVVVEKRGGAGWVRVAGATTGPDGLWEARAAWRRAGAVRARSAGVASPAVEVGVLARLSTRQVSRRIRAGRALLVRGTLRPRGEVIVRVERQTPAGRWIPAGSFPARLRRSEWSVRVPLRKPALYRVTAATDDVVGRTQHVRAVRRRR